MYFAEGLPYVIANNLSVVLLKSLNAANDIIGYTSLLYLPWSIKPLWSPLVDGKSTKRNWMLSMQLLLGILFILMSFILITNSNFAIIIFIFALIAFISATHDIAIDGYYLIALDKKDQAFFTGIRSTFYRLSVIFGSGVLVVIAGNYSNVLNSVNFGWAIAFAIASVIFIALYFYHFFVSPKVEINKNEENKKFYIHFLNSFKGYFKQPAIGLIISFILLYRLGEGILVKMAQPFLLDSSDTGGLALQIADVGFMYGTIGTTCLVIGGILGGWIVKKFTLRKTIWILAICMNLPNLLYVYLSIFKPNDVLIIDLNFLQSNWQLSIYPIVQICIAIEQFGYGLGFTGFMIYLLYISKGKYQTSHYAISTGFMAVGMMIPGFVSGILQMWLGYIGLFILASIATLPGMVLLYFIPKDIENDHY